MIIFNWLYQNLVDSSMVKQSKRGLGGPGFAGGLILAIGVLLVLAIIFYPKISHAAEIFFSLLGLEDENKDQKLTGSQLNTISQSPEFTISIVTRAYEKCAAMKENDCLCNSGENLDLEIGQKMTISKSGTKDIEVSYKGKSLIIPEVEGCIINTVVRNPDYLFSDVKNPLGRMELAKDGSTDKITSLDRNNNKFSFQLNPISLFRHKESNNLYLCLTTPTISHRLCNN
jgi:hypothetical protein